MVDKKIIAQVELLDIIQQHSDENSLQSIREIGDSLKKFAKDAVNFGLDKQDIVNVLNVMTKRHSVKEEQLATILAEHLESMQKIKLICQRAKTFGTEEKDIDDILELLKGKV